MTYALRTNIQNAAALNKGRVFKWLRKS